METEIVRGDIQSTGNSIKDIGRSGTRFATREIWKILKKIFKTLSSKIYRDRFEGMKRVFKDGATKQLDSISGLTFDEMQEMAVEYRKDGLEFVIRVENDKDGSVDKLNTRAEINKFTKTKYELEKTRKKLEEKPRDEVLQLKVIKLQKEYDLLVDKFKGKTFKIITNKSREDYNNSIRIKIIERRTAFLNSKFEKEFVSDNNESKLYDEAKFKSFMEKCKKENKLVNLNEKELAKMFAELHKDGTVDKEVFEKNYTVHTVDAQTGAVLLADLEDDNIDYAVEKGIMTKQQEGGLEEKQECIKIYIKDEDMPFYQTKVLSKKGEYTHISDNKNKQATGEKDAFYIPESKVKEVQRLFKDEEYDFNYAKNDKGENVVKITLTNEQIFKATQNEKNTNAVADVLEKIREEDKIKTYKAIKDPNRRYEFLYSTKNEDNREVIRYKETLKRCEEGKGSSLSKDEENEFANIYAQEDQKEIDRFINRLYEERQNNKSSVDNKESETTTTSATLNNSKAEEKENFKIDFSDEEIEKE